MSAGGSLPLPDRHDGRPPEHTPDLDHPRHRRPPREGPWPRVPKRRRRKAPFGRPGDQRAPFSVEQSDGCVGIPGRINRKIPQHPRVLILIRRYETRGSRGPPYDLGIEGPVQKTVDLLDKIDPVSQPLLFHRTQALASDQERGRTEHTDRDQCDQQRNEPSPPAST